MIETGIGIVALIIGFFIGYLLKIKGLNKKAEAITKEAEAKAEVVKNEKILEAKAKFLQLKEKHEELVNKKNSKIAAEENRLKQRENSLNQRRDDLRVKTKKIEQESRQNEELKEQLKKQKNVLEHKASDLDKQKKEYILQLENIAGFTAEQAKEELVKSLKAEAKSEAMIYINDVMEEAKLTANKKSKQLILKTIQRIGTETAVENAVTVFHIENDDIKGRIIGREGRNIRALEAATGIEIIVDDTPESIILSGFDPIRREVARLALHQLVTDGRIHPAKIEEVVGRTRKQLEEEILEIGKKTAIDLGIHGLHRELLRMIGKMQYRSSYGQNLLQHSRETAKLCAVMAAELGLDAKLAKRAGLLHDIGKVPDEEIETPHAIYGMKLAERFKEQPEVCNAIGAHHDEIEMTSLISPIVQVCDAISGARPGARREIAESYIKRIKKLESLASEEEGVMKTYAIQAGRELRVIVGSNKVSDKDVENISLNIAKRIEENMTYPGQVRITVIRETRSVSYAK